MTPEEVKAKAMAYYDAGYWFSDEHPGKIMPWGTWDMIDVPMEVWYFFLGIRFGFGVKSKADLERDRRTNG